MIRQEFRLHIKNQIVDQLRQGAFYDALAPELPAAVIISNEVGYLVGHGFGGKLQLINRTLLQADGDDLVPAQYIVDGEGGDVQLAGELGRDCDAVEVGTVLQGLRKPMGQRGEICHELRRHFKGDGVIGWDLNELPVAVVQAVDQDGDIDKDLDEDLTDMVHVLYPQFFRFEERRPILQQSKNLRDQAGSQVDGKPAFKKRHRQGRCGLQPAEPNAVRGHPDVLALGKVS